MSERSDFSKLVVSAMKTTLHPLMAAAALVLTTQCTEGNEPPSSAGRNAAEQCLSYREIKNQCDEAFTQCLNSHIQSIPSMTRGHSLCWPCKDVCMQENGSWPAELPDGRPCR